MHKRTLVAVATTMGVAMGAPSAHAGAKLAIGDDSSIDLGFRVQALYLRNDKDFSSNRDEFKVRRGRFRLKGDVTKWVTAFLQTEFSNDDGGTGGDNRVIDAWVKVKPHDLANITGGLHMTAVARQNLTTSGALMAIDRPGINNYLLTWGTQGRAAFNNGTLPGTGVGLRGDNNVRDLGASIFGRHSFGDNVHIKYYGGVFEGSDFRQNDPERYAVRAQLNFLDPEPGYFQASTYLGAKKTIAIGAGYDTQEAVAVDAVTGDDVDYKFWTVDAFADYPMGPGSLTAEAAYNKMDLDGTDNPLAATPGGSALGVPASQAEGDGYYVQAGYYFKKKFLGGNWQPWLAYEKWDAEASNEAGDWDAYRVGVSYFILGHNANIKAGYEKVSNDTPGEDNVGTFVVGFYTTY